MRPRHAVVDDSVREPLVTFVTSEEEGNIHVLVNDVAPMELVETIARNFSRRIHQPVKVFHDRHLEKYRVCPMPPGARGNFVAYGEVCFECDIPVNVARIPRPRNSWILYRQHQSAVMKERYPGITASEISTASSRMWRREPKHVKAYWKKQAQEEDRLHKEKYPNYKYTTKKSTLKK
ncbi:hypothetical protein CP533_6273 [Ophiocordyceps camponoti-saundersi (nom. inval.)]|nr:hypothetical protein CP533_6273 [Ophiocordyceps camponoti-saundersi (nom. inval.)]